MWMEEQASLTLETQGGRNQEALERGQDEAVLDFVANLQSSSVMAWRTQSHVKGVSVRQTCAEELPASMSSTA